MNVYDFDGTIYDGDSTLDFYFFCLKKHPWIITYGIYQIYGMFLHIIRKIDTTAMKEYFFSFLVGLYDTNILVENFWSKHQHKIAKWYLMQKEKTDVIISASPEFLLMPICCRLGIQPAIATRVDPASGKIQGRNCKGQEKIKRFYERFPNSKIYKFYSDSWTDEPLAFLAIEPFFVKKQKIVVWKGTPYDKK